MSASIASAFVVALFASGSPSAGDVAHEADARQFLQVAGGGDLILNRGDSRRPHVEVPSMAPPVGGEFQASPTNGAGANAAERGGNAESTRGLGDHRPGELYLVPGDHRPGDLDNQGTHRPGDLG